MNAFRELRAFVSVLSLTVLFSPLSASAVVTPVVAFDSFGPGNSYLTSVGWGVSGVSTSGGYRGQAEWFVPGISGNVSTIQLAMFRSSGSGRSNFYLTEDNGGIPGNIMESYLNVLSPGGLLTLNSTSQSLLQSGSKYWLSAEPADNTTVSGWYENNQNYHPGFAFERSQGGWSFIDPSFAPSSGVFRVSATPVPEPSVLGLIIPCAGLFIRRFRRGVGGK